jgi:triosephosphate isomerase (TIM)
VSRGPFFAANWKMYMDPETARDYANAFELLAEPFVDDAYIALCAPFVCLETLSEELEDSEIGIGAQDCYWEPEGAFTGEISARMLRELVDCCIVGHSERRRLFGETDEMVARKVSALLAQEITPIVCVGESLEENQAGRTAERVTAQVVAGLGHLTDEQRGAIVIAYEPIWAIGTGLADTPESANATIAVIRSAAGGLDQAVMLYGGSMKPGNAEALCRQPNIDGGLVGSASLDPGAFAELIVNGLKGGDAR